MSHDYPILKLILRILTNATIGSIEFNTERYNKH